MNGALVCSKHLVDNKTVALNDRLIYIADVPNESFEPQCLLGHSTLAAVSEVLDGKTNVYSLSSQHPTKERSPDEASDNLIGLFVIEYDNDGYATENVSRLFV